MKRALVIGGSVAGLLAARVLTDHADEVVVVDRDELGIAPAGRKGVPQGRHVHGLLARGLEEMERLFPGIMAELAAEGAEVADPGIDLHWYVAGERKPPAGIGNGIACTRPFLEAHLRRRLTALRAVTMVHGRVDRLTATDGTVDGVVLEAPSETTAGEHLKGDLVVDCSGRTSRADAWLGALGYDAPPRRTVNVELGYATRLFPRQPGDRLGGARGILSVVERADGFRGSAAFAVEGARWIVTVGGYHDDRPTMDPADFSSRLATDPAVPLQGFAARDDALTDVVTFRYPASVRRDYDRCTRLPGGFLAAGDAVASFNPIYGQGMTSAALHAAQIGAYLDSGATPFEPAAGYFRRLRSVVDSVWTLSTTADFRLSHVTGDRPRGLWLTQHVNDLYTQATLRDVATHRLFLRVLNLQARPELMARPDHLLRAWRASRRPLPVDAARAP
ncbi:MAG TPA: FAD-dependent monooxygenase [Acidimicrobiales bacterium]|nr:FAD-dependent monooxygenase [Acidimicrobiales bacterium]